MTDQFNAALEAAGVQFDDMPDLEDDDSPPNAVTRTAMRFAVAGLIVAILTIACVVIELCGGVA
jgi:hypothetical protein